MKKIIDFLNKNGIIILIICSIILIFKSCGSNNEMNKVNKRLDKMNSSIITTDSIIDTKISTYEFNKQMKIYNLKVEKSTLHNMNEIVLKNIRPSQRINEIDIAIQELTEDKGADLVKNK